MWAERATRHGADGIAGTTVLSGCGGSEGPGWGSKSTRAQQADSLYRRVLRCPAAGWVFARRRGCGATGLWCGARIRDRHRQRAGLAAARRIPTMDRYGRLSSADRHRCGTARFRALRLGGGGRGDLVFRSASRTRPRMTRFISYATLPRSLVCQISPPATIPTLGCPTTRSTAGSVVQTSACGMCRAISRRCGWCRGHWPNAGHEVTRPSACSSGRGPQAPAQPAPLTPVEQDSAEQIACAVGDRDDVTPSSLRVR